ncbi:Chitinase 3 [Acorus calamus]|uniref:chitinase n=1 Tax=Acorus calamus TaxID=4465 RepID=A0AAV9E046_ACOCL|nr:Chitinase 3 [Acorus calamus]
MKGYTVILLFLTITTTSMVVSGQPICGKEANNKLCPNDLCCSKYGYCGISVYHCGDGCQSQCDGADPEPPEEGVGPVGSLVSQSLFEEMLKHRNNEVCPARNFFRYHDFMVSGNSFKGFASTGNEDTRKREMAAFLAHTSHQTTGGWSTAPEPYTWGYCFKETASPAYFCEGSCEEKYPCAADKHYYGRGPMRITTNCMYGEAGEYLGVDLLNNPELVATNGTISFETAFLFWMTAHPPKPSCHDVMTGKWRPSENDWKNGRRQGFGETINIINGAEECGENNMEDRANDRIGYYKRYCDMLGVSYGPHLDCKNAQPYPPIWEVVARDMK